MTKTEGDHFTMNTTGNPLTLPTQPPTRSETLNIRLTETEKAAVETLAARQGIAPSQMARHFLLQAVAHYARQMEGEAAAHEQSDR
jgi:hypothetical protein